MNSELDPELLQQVRTILRRDLKLADDEPLAVDMPFFGGQIDLDSLDMLLLLTSVERQFSVRIPNESVGREVFQSVGSLVRYVQNHRPSQDAQSAPTPPSAIDWLAKLPHAEPFRFISRVIDVRPGESAQGVWKLRGDEPFFAGHFPGHPIVPGVLIAEALAQLSGIAGPETISRGGKLARIDVRFEQSATPPLDIELNSKFLRASGDLQIFDVWARCGEIALARGSITLYRGSES